MSQPVEKNKIRSTRNAPGGRTRGHSVVCALMLMLAAVIWGSAFVSQSVGAQYVGAFTFLTGRCWVAVIFLAPIARIAARRTGSGAAPFPKRRLCLLAGTACGLALCAASAAQQIGIAYTTTAKAGFITAMYVVLVPVISIFLGRAPEPKIWLCVAMGIAGLYFLCMTGSLEGVNFGDAVMLVSALLFSVQILVVSHFVQVINGVVLSFLQVLAEGVFATVLMLALETPTLEQIRLALPSMLYAGIMSSGVAYTLQITGQEGLDPTVASLIMCLESVFGALCGWLVLGQALTARELTGCALMFAAIVFSQLPSRRTARKAAAEES